VKRGKRVMTRRRRRREEEEEEEEEDLDMEDILLQQLLELPSSCDSELEDAIIDAMEMSWEGEMEGAFRAGKQRRGLVMAQEGVRTREQRFSKGTGVPRGEEGRGREEGGRRGVGFGGSGRGDLSDVVMGGVGVGQE